MVFLDIGIAVPSWLQHPRDVALEPCVGVIAAALLHEGKEVACQLEIERVLPGLEKLVVVDPPLAPVLRLLPENVPLLVEGMVLRTPEDAAGVGVLRFEEAIHGAVVAAKCRRVVIPVDRHRQCIGGQGAEKGLFPTVVVLSGHDVILMCDL